MIPPSTTYYTSESVLRTVLTFTSIAIIDWISYCSRDTVCDDVIFRPACAKLFKGPRFLSEHLREKAIPLRRLENNRFFSFGPSSKACMLW